MLEMISLLVLSIIISFLWKISDFFQRSKIWKIRQLKVFWKEEKSVDKNITKKWKNFEKKKSLMKVSKMNEVSWKKKSSRNDELSRNDWKTVERMPVKWKKRVVNKLRTVWIRK